MHRRRSALVSATALIALLAPATARSSEYPPQVVRGLTVPAGFAAVPFGQVPELTTSLTWGADTAAAAEDHGVLLYVTATRNPFGAGDAPLDGKVYAFTDEGGEPTQVAGGLDQPLGIVMGPDETLYVSENDNGRGRITALRDADGDGQFETRRTVLKNLPNGRHQTNGMTFGPDGMLYVANGNATDDGIECGPNNGPNLRNKVSELPPPLDEPYQQLLEAYEERFRNVDCPEGHVERKPWTGAIVRVNPAWTDLDLLTDVVVDPDLFYGTVDENGDIDPTVLDDEQVLVSPGYRNIYDVDFNPRIPNEIWTPMNGSDDPSSGEPLFALPVDNEQVVGFDEETQQPIFGPVIEDAGFPSCLYDPHINPFPEPSIGGHPHPGNPVPEHNPNLAVQEKFGMCPIDTVMRPRDIFDEGHEGTSGMTFERGNNFPARYDGDLFTAEWGSLWNLNGGTVTGHKIIHHDIRPDGTVEREREFMSGILPMDVTFGPDGYMYVADMPGQIYQVRFVAEVAEDVVEVDIVDPGNTGNPVFDPPVVTIVQDQTVRWCNQDDQPHNITGVLKVKTIQEAQDPEGLNPPGDEIDSAGNLAQGQCHTFRFDVVSATYHYQSTNPDNALEGIRMRGTIHVAHMMR